MGRLERPDCTWQLGEQARIRDSIEAADVPRQPFDSNTEASRGGYPFFYNCQIR
jgi:hypothetical protein